MRYFLIIFILLVILPEIALIWFDQLDVTSPHLLFRSYWLDSDEPDGNEVKDFIQWLCFH